MSKNIIIQEGGTNYQFTAKKLKTDKVGGGSVLWVPEEETVLKKITITEEGTYKASDEGVYGYSEVKVDVTGSGSVHGKRITQNGTYKAEDDGYIGYSKVKVNVRGGNGSADSSGRPITSFDSDGNVEYAPGGIGSAVFGVDTDTGEWVTVGVDSSGNLVKTTIPSGIEIVTPPTKTNYNSGEAINYSGIIVILKGGNSAIFSNSDYPNGRIPMQELIFVKSVAEASESFTPSSGIIPISINAGSSDVLQFTDGGIEEISFSEGLMIHVPYRNAGYYGIFASSNQNAYASVVNYDGNNRITNEFNVGLNSSYTRNGKTVYYALTSGIEVFVHGSASTETDPAIMEYNTGLIAWCMIYDNSGQSSDEVPVKWRSPYDGNTYEDSFDITVTGGNSSGTTGSTDGGGYSDDSGGSSSGGGGGF